MQTFKIDQKLYWINELKSWLRAGATITLLILFFSLFSTVTKDKIFTTILVVVLLKASHLLTEYRIKGIRIDESKNQLSFLLNSHLTGREIKIYELAQVSSELIEHSGWRKYISSSIILKIYLNSKRRFQISCRYGFTPETLRSIHNSLHSSTLYKATDTTCT